jgi:predicted ATPase
MIFLHRIAFEPVSDSDQNVWPFTVPSLRGLEVLELRTPVTFFVGENGSGKSTLLEALALSSKLPPATGVPLEHDETLDAIKPLARSLRLGWQPRTHYGFFLRAEDFFNFARETRKRIESMDEMAERFGDDPRVRGYCLPKNTPSPRVTAKISMQCRTAKVSSNFSKVVVCPAAFTCWTNPKPLSPRNANSPFSAS